MSDDPDNRSSATRRLSKRYSGFKQYANLSGDSGVLEYVLGPDAIVVRFQGRADYYLYTAQKTGRGCIEEMTRRAKAGRGLSGYISERVKEKYEWKGSRPELIRYIDKTRSAG